MTAAPEDQGTVEETGLVWAVRGSFRRYVRNVARGSETTHDGAGQLPDGRLYFPIADVALHSMGEGTVGCGGAARFFGHAGFIDVTLARPTVTLDGGTGVLAVEAGPGLPLPLVDLRVTEREAADGMLRITADARLREEAVGLFDEVYPAGAEFDPLELRVRLA